MALSSAQSLARCEIRWYPGDDLQSVVVQEMRPLSRHDCWRSADLRGGGESDHKKVDSGSFAAIAIDVLDRSDMKVSYPTPSRRLNRNRLIEGKRG